MDIRKTIQDRLKESILVIDGAMGTMIQRHKLEEKDYRGERFKDWPSDLKGNNDLLVLTQPAIIEGIHREYLEAGADIIETNTFNAQQISMADYHMEALAFEINVAAATLAKKAATDYTARNPDKPRFVAGAIGPMNKTLSLSPDVNNPGFRAVSFDEVATAYYEQIKGLVEGGVDLLLIETIFDTLNAKAAIYAIKKYFRDSHRPELPILISGTITDASGRTLSGQTLEAFYVSVMHARPLSIGLNCALGAAEMRSHIEVVVQDTGTGISEEGLKRLMEANYYSTRGTEGEAGTGLGLMLCKEFLSRNGGEMRIESEPGKGSTFAFTLPKGGAGEGGGGAEAGRGGEGAPGSTEVADGI